MRSPIASFCVASMPRRGCRSAGQGWVVRSPAFRRFRNSAGRRRRIGQHQHHQHVECRQDSVPARRVGVPQAALAAAADDAMSRSDDDRSGLGLDAAGPGRARMAAPDWSRAPPRRRSGRSRTAASAPCAMRQTRRAARFPSPRPDGWHSASRQRLQDAFNCPYYSSALLARSGWPVSRPCLRCAPSTAGRRGRGWRNVPCPILQ